MIGCRCPLIPGSNSFLFSPFSLFTIMTSHYDGVPCDVPQRPDSHQFGRYLVLLSVSWLLFISMSLTTGPQGSVGTVRDIRGFVTKFYTPEGN